MKSFKSFKDYIFSQLFPAYYKENDTYPNPNFENKGILERFIEVCSEYFDNNITDSIDYLNFIPDSNDDSEKYLPENIFPSLNNFLDIIDLNKTPDLFLNYLWEYFGSFPYAYGLITNGEPLTRENLKNWLRDSSYSTWFKTNKIFPRANPRTLLRYVITLYKIRCTPLFYEVLGNFYGVEITLSDPYSNLGLSTNKIVAVYPKYEENDNGTYKLDSEGNPIPIKDSATGEQIYECSAYPQELSELLPWIRAYYRRGDDESCYQCWPLYFTVKIPPDKWDALDLDNDEDKKLEIEKAFIRIFDRYKPIWIKDFVSSDNNPTSDDSQVSIEQGTSTPVDVEINTSAVLYIPNEESKPDIPIINIDTSAIIYIPNEGNEDEPIVTDINTSAVLYIPNSGGDEPVEPDITNINTEAIINIPNEESKSIEEIDSQAIINIPNSDS